MTIQLPSIAIEGLLLISICLVYLAYKYGFKKSVLENHRMKLFNYRSKLYDMASKGLISPDHNSYRYMEEYLNASIRFAHKMNTFYFLFTTFVYKMGWYKPERPFRFDEIPDVNSLPNDVKGELTKIKHSSFNDIIQFVAVYSPSWYMFSEIYKLLSVSKSSAKEITRFVVSSDLDLEEYNYKREQKDKENKMQPA